MDLQSVTKIVVLQELVSMLFEAGFRQYENPVAAAQQYAERVQETASKVANEANEPQLAMLLEAEFAHFFERVVKRLREDEAPFSPRPAQ